MYERVKQSGYYVEFKLLYMMRSSIKWNETREQKRLTDTTAVTFYSSSSKKKILQNIKKNRMDLCEIRRESVSMYDFHVM
jgi:hypothetical protein